MTTMRDIFRETCSWLATINRRLQCSYIYFICHGYLWLTLLTANYTCHIELPWTIYIAIWYAFIIFQICKAVTAVTSYYIDIVASLHTHVHSILVFANIRHNIRCSQIYNSLIVANYVRCSKYCFMAVHPIHITHKIFKFCCNINNFMYACSYAARQ